MWIPSLPGYLAHREGVEVAEVVEWLNRRSGLLGVSGTSRDMRELLRARDRGDGRAALAVEMFCYRAKKQVGAYLAALGGADAVVFAGGIGERAPEVRAEICSGMEWCGLTLNPERNARAVGEEARISADGSPSHPLGPQSLSRRGGYWLLFPMTQKRTSVRLRLPSCLHAPIGTIV